MRVIVCDIFLEPPQPCTIIIPTFTTFTTAQQPQATAIYQYFLLKAFS